MDIQTNPLGPLREVKDRDKFIRRFYIIALVLVTLFSLSSLINSIVSSSNANSSITKLTTSVGVLTTNLTNSQNKSKEQTKVETELRHVLASQQKTIGKQAEIILLEKQHVVPEFAFLVKFAEVTVFFMADVIEQNKIALSRDLRILLSLESHGIG